MIVTIFLLLVSFDTSACVSNDCIDLAKQRLCQKFRAGRTRSCVNDPGVNARYHREDDCMSFASDHPDTSKSRQLIFANILRLQFYQVFYRDQQRNNFERSNFKAHVRLDFQRQDVVA